MFLKRFISHELTYLEAVVKSAVNSCVLFFGVPLTTCVVVHIDIARKGMAVKSVRAQHAIKTTQVRNKGCDIRLLPNTPQRSGMAGQGEGAGVEYTSRDLERYLSISPFRLKQSVNFRKRRKT